MSPTSLNFASALKTAYEASLKHLDSLDAAPVAAQATVAQLRAQLQKPLNTSGLPADEVVRELVRDVDGGLHGNAGGRFFGWVMGGAVPASLAADWLTSTWDQNAGMYAVAPSAAIAEEVAGEWLKELLDLPRAASFAFVTGCQMAHVTCLAAARNGLHAQRGYDVETLGLSGAPPVRILATAHLHSSALRAIRLLGFGTGSIEYIAVDEKEQVRADALCDALARHHGEPIIVILQAGEIHTGVSDNFTELIPLAKAAGAWVHVDGAFGLWARASEKLRAQVAGVELADSWATDGHKWLNVPYDSGYAFVRDREAHRRAFTQKAAYLHANNENRDQVDWNPEFSRRARGFATYAAIRQLGRSGIAEIVENCCRHAYAITTGIGKLKGARALNVPCLNQGVVQFLDPRAGATAEDHARRTEQVIERVLASGEAFFKPSVWKGEKVMRISVCSWQTSDEDVERAIRAVENALQSFD